MDQTGRALQKPYREMTKLEKAQADLARTGYRLLFAGAAFLSFGIMAARGMMGLFDTTTRGIHILGDFERVFGRIKNALAEAIIDMFGETIEGWIDQLDELAENETWKKLVAGTLFATVETLITIGPVLIALGFAAKFLAAFGAALLSAGLITAESATALTATAGTIMGWTIAIALTLIVASIIWEFLPEAWQKAVTKFKEKFTENLQNMYNIMEEGWLAKQINKMMDKWLGLGGEEDPWGGIYRGGQGNWGVDGGEGFGGGGAGVRDGGVNITIYNEKDISTDVRVDDPIAWETERRSGRTGARR